MSGIFNEFSTGAAQLLNTWADPLTYVNTAGCENGSGSIIREGRIGFSKFSTESAEILSVIHTLWHLQVWGNDRDDVRCPFVANKENEQTYEFNNGIEK